LVISEQDVHVHLTLLKLYLVFFRTFLDSPEKVNITRMKAFKYYWVKKTEEDGDWHLVEYRSDQVSYSIPGFRHEGV
jgi:hypothetical protein